MKKSWQPSRNARLTLQQLGLSSTQVDQALEAYCHQSEMPSDLAFMRFARDTASDGAVARRAAEILELPLHWRPPAVIASQLQAAGFESEAITHYAELFVISTREQGRALRDPGKAFLAYCRHRPRTLHAPLPPDWLPDTGTLERLVANGVLDRSRIPESIDRFVACHGQALSGDWERSYQDWIEGKAFASGQAEQRSRH